MVNPLRFLVDAFVNTFGITRPSPRQETQAGWFIAGMLVIVLLAVAAAVWLLRTALAHG